MGQVKDIMEKNVITIEYNKTALDAACLISEKDVSFLVIMKYNLPIGVLSESDFVRRLAANDKKSSEMQISDIMSRKFRWVDPSTTIEDAIQKMLNNNIRRLQTAVKEEFYTGVRFAEWLGLKKEGLMKYYGLDQTNYWRMAKYYEFHR